MTTTTVERASVGWGFWLRWVLASIVGFGLGAAVAGQSFDIDIGGGFAVVGAVFGTIFGAAGGMAQWLVLRQQVERAGWWVLATAGGWAVAGAVAIGVAEAVGGDTGSVVGGVAFVVAFAAAGGLLQWLVLRRQIAPAGLWMVANTLGLFMGFIVGFPLFSIASAAGNFAIGLAIFGAGLGAGSGAITGIALDRLLRHHVSAPRLELPTARAG